MITIIDYGMGNIGSIENMIKKLGFKSLITSDPKIISRSSKIILPGVGSFDEGMKNLSKLKIVAALKEANKKGAKILGICLGMQLLTKSSEEGELAGLGFINAKTIKFKLSKDHKIPHMGWNYVDIKSKNKLTLDLIQKSRFYFVHSYHVVCEDKSNVMMVTNYGVEFTSAIVKNNVFGVQFHPEKSHKFGLKLMENFIKNV